jgi:hypothetical protein
MSEVEKWLQIRKDEALKIDPATAEMTWDYADVCDPYGVNPCPGQACIGREWFVRSPGSDVWVWWGDLPEEVQNALRARDE